MGLEEVRVVPPQDEGGALDLGTVSHEKHAIWWRFEKIRPLTFMKIGFDQYGRL